MPFKFDEIPVSMKLDETVKAALDQIKKEKRRKSGRKFLVGCRLRGRRDILCQQSGACR